MENKIIVYLKGGLVIELEGEDASDFRQQYGNQISPTRPIRMNIDGGVLTITRSDVVATWDAPDEQASPVRLIDDVNG